MKHVRTFFLLAALTFSIGTLGQAQAKPAAPAASPAPQAQTTPQPPPTVAGPIDTQVGIIEREIVAAAEAMPDDKFNFAPANLNIPNTKPVRTFAEQAKHVATVNFMLWAPLVGEKPPFDVNNGDGPASMTSKAEIVKYLKDSYAVGHRAAKSMNMDNVLGTVQSPFGAGTISRLFCATFGVAHGFDHYGQMVEYLRMNAILPPASRGNN
jgi:hypothetical protein